MHSIFLIKRQQLGGSRAHSNSIVKEYFNVLILIFIGGPCTVSGGWLRLTANRISYQTCQINRVLGNRAVYQTTIITGLSNLKFSYIDFFVPLLYNFINMAYPSEILFNDFYSNNSFKSNIPFTLLSLIKANTDIGLTLIY